VPLHRDPEQPLGVDAPGAAAIQELLTVRPGGQAARLWNSVALFSDLDGNKPEGCRRTTAAHARSWLDEGPKPANPPLGAFLARYWSALSYGRRSPTAVCGSGSTPPRGQDGTHFVPAG